MFRSICKENPLKIGPESYLSKFSKHPKPAERFLTGTQPRGILALDIRGSKQLTAKVSLGTLHRDEDYRQCPELLAVHVCFLKSRCFGSPVSKLT